MSRPFSGRFSATLIFVPGHSNIPENCRADELTRAGALLPKSSSIGLGMPLAAVKPPSSNSCSIARLSWPLMDRCPTYQLFELGCDIISKTLAMLACHCVMERYPKRMQLPFKTLLHFYHFKNILNMSSLIANKIRMNFNLVIIKILYYSHNFVHHCSQLDVNNNNCYVCYSSVYPLCVNNNNY